MIAWVAVQFWDELHCNATRKVNCTRPRLVQFISFLIALLVQFIPNCTATHAITYTHRLVTRYQTRNVVCIENEDKGVLVTLSLPGAGLDFHAKCVKVQN